MARRRFGPLKLGPVFNLRATVRGLNQYTKKLDNDVLFEQAHASMEEATREVYRKVYDFLPDDTGRVKRTLHYGVTGTTIHDLNGIVMSPEKYFRMINYGRRAGGRMPPSSPIEAWVRRHYFYFGAGISQKQITYVLRRAIAKRGIPGLHVLEYAIETTRKHFGTIFIEKFLSDWRGPGPTER